VGFYLLDRPNPYGPNYYTTRNNRLLAIVVHITAGADDLDTLNDLSAENVSHYAATTDRDVSWHSGSDADSWIFLLPSGYTAWHASNYNSCTYGHEISKRTTDWRNVPENWIDKTLRMSALGPDGRSGLRKIALDNGIPLRWATKAELDHARATGGGPVGFITHAEIQWDDRRDPGYVTEGGRTFDTFPRARFMALLNGTEEDDMPLDANRDYPAFLAMAQRAIAFDLRPGGAGATHLLGPTIYEQLAAIRATLAAVAADPDITPAELERVVDAAVERHTPTPEQVAAAQLPHIKDAVRAVLGEDNTDQADQIVDELTRRLANTSPTT
jgi:hypothetical protein